MTRIVNYMEAAVSFELEPAEAIQHFADKGLRTTFDWRDMISEEHDAAFTVAKMMDNDLLATVKRNLDKAMVDGSTLEEFKKEMIPRLQQAGWWGKRDVVDPETGRVVKAQLGSASRLETIFRTNLLSSYSAGHWEMIETNAQAAPYLMYDAVDDHRTRRDHGQWDNTVRPVSDAFWDEWTPPNGYNCRCGVIQLSADELDDYGLSISDPPRVQRRRWTNPRTGKVVHVPEGIDPTFVGNPGRRRMQKLRDLYQEKLQDLPPDLRSAAMKPLSSGAMDRSRADNLKRLGDLSGLLLAGHLAAGQNDDEDTDPTV